MLQAQKIWICFKSKQLNVAFTRAKEKLIIGNRRVICKFKDNMLYKFLKYVYELNRIYDWVDKWYLKL